MSSLIIAGVALAGGAAALRVISRQLPKANAAAQAAQAAAKRHMPKPPGSGQAAGAGDAAAGAGEAAPGAGAKAQANSWFKQSMDEVFGSGHYKGGFDAKMNRAEAAKILGVSTTSSKDAVKKAHKRLMLINHPDRGGSAYMATKVNEAKATLEQSK